MFKLIFLVILYTSQKVFCQENSTDLIENTGNITAIKNKILENYDKLIRPNSGGEPVRIRVSIAVWKIVSIDEVEMEWTSSMFLEEIWNDPRLAYDAEAGVEWIPFQKDPDLFWMPTIYFMNEKKADLGEYFGEYDELKLYPNGTLERRRALTIKSDCVIDFHYYPFGFFKCPMTIVYTSYSYREQRVEWMDTATSSIIVNTAGSYHQFIYVGVLPYDQSTFASNHPKYKSWIQFDVYFRRAVEYYILQWYIPSGTVVVLSFFAFWLAPVGERIGVGMTSTLTIAILWSSIDSSLPKVTYIKGIDMYFGMCFILCCSSLLVNTIIGYMESQKKNQNPDDSRARKFFRRLVIRWNAQKFINRLARFFYPLTFLGFCIFYYVYYIPDINSQIEVMKKQKNFKALMQ